ncbi:MAG: M20/M25/M40 family metallo-hydrolase [Candidatus Heimdallarchaeota archaeon]|nr:M20/M25/M40 family metallo-hydrolase [Candidatus Heimdallarchaeota archaeon]
MKKKSISLLQELIRNKCVNYDTPESGQEIKSVNTLAKYFDSYNLSEYEVLESVEGRANLLIKISGSEKSPSLMYQNHLDVVPATPEDWQVDPYEGVIKDNWIWGRGAIDMLMFTASQAVAFAHLINNEFKPKGDFYFLAVADEEGGGTYGAKWLVENHPDKIGADFMMGEFGGTMIETPTGWKNTVMFGEKGTGWTSLNIKGTPGHGSAPYKADNAIETMAKILDKIRKNPPDTVVTEEWKLMVEGFGRGRIFQYLMTHRPTLNILMSLLGRRDPGQVKALHSLTRMTITPTKSNAGEKANVIPDRSYLGFDIRLLPGQDYEYVKKYFNKTLGKLMDKVELNQDLYWPGTSDRWDTPLIDSIAKINKKYQPDTEIMPLFVGGGTDARFFRELGTKCYSTSILTKKVTSELMGQIFHGIDERVPVEAVENTTLFFKDLALDFL